MLVFFRVFSHCCSVFRFVQAIDISFGNGKVLGFITNLPVLCISLSLFRKQPGVLCIQVFHLRELSHAEFIERFLRRFVDYQFFPVGFEELFTVTGFSVRLLSVPGFHVADDVFLQLSDFL